MYVMDLLKVLARRWYVLLAGIVLVGGAAAGVVRVVPTNYEASGNVLILLPPKGTSDKPINPYLETPPGLSIAAQIIGGVLATPQQERSIAAAGFTSEYSVGQTPGSSVPLLHVTVEDTDPDMAVATLKEVIRRTEAELADLQSDAGAPPTQRMVAHTVSVTEQAEVLSGAKVRALAVVGAVGTVLTLVAAFALERWRKEVRRRRQAEHEARRRPKLFRCAHGPQLCEPGCHEARGQRLARGTTPRNNRRPGLSTSASGPFSHGFSPVVTPAWVRRFRDRARARRACNAGTTTGTGFLLLYCALLYLIPAALIVRPIGAAGTPAALLAMAGLLWWLCARVVELTPRLGGNPVSVALGGFVVAVLASYAWGMTTGWYSPAGIQGDTDNLYDLIPATPTELREVMMTAADRGLLAVAAWAGVVMMCTASLRTWAAIDRVIAWIVGLATVVAMLGIVQFFTGLDISGFIRIPGLVANTDFGGVLERSVLRRVAATAIHPIEFGVVMGACFPLALHRAAFSPHQVRGWLQVAAIGTAAMMSVSRSAVLVMGIALAILFVGWPREWRSRAVVIGPIALVALRLLVPGLLGTIRTMWTNLFADSSTTGRTGDYGVVLHLFARNPVFGRGHFTFVPRYYRIVDNQFLVSLVEVGAVGLTAFVTLAGAAILATLMARRRGTSAEHRHLALALCASIAGIIVSFATFDALGFQMVSGTTFLLFGLAGACWQVATTEQRARRSGRSEPLPPAAGEALSESGVRSSPTHSDKAL